MFTCPLSQLALGERPGQADKAPSRQSSLQAVHATHGLPLLEDTGEEDVNTLKLKHLSEAVSLLSDPPVSGFKIRHARES